MSPCVGKLPDRALQFEATLFLHKDLPFRKITETNCRALFGVMWGCTGFWGLGLGTLPGGENRLGREMDMTWKLGSYNRLVGIILATVSSMVT